MIKENEEFNETNYINVSTPYFYKYIRYISPNKNNTDISPIKLYGKPQSDKSESKCFQATNLPLISINTENSTEPLKKEQKINCNIFIINQGKIETNGEAIIRIRGKSSSLGPKKPYKIKFTHKQKILDFKGDYKKWVLIANYFDRTLLRNALAYKISELMEFDYTPRCTPVDVVLNGNFRGNYYLCEEIEVGKNRVNIEKMGVNDINEPNITGGYLLEFDGWKAMAKEKYYETQKGIQLRIIYPDEKEINTEQENYIMNKLNKLENEIYNDILDSLDLDSYSKHFVVREFCGDPDSVWSSVYFTKQRNDDKFKFGPLWDFDMSFDNDDLLIPTNEKNDFCFNYGWSAGTLKNITNVLIGNRNVIEYIQKIWEKSCNTILNENILTNFLEEKKIYLKENAELNYLKWDNYVPEKREWADSMYDERKEPYESSVEKLKDFIRKRFEVLSNLISNAVSSSK